MPGRNRSRSKTLNARMRRSRADQAGRVPAASAAAPGSTGSGSSPSSPPHKLAEHPQVHDLRRHIVVEVAVLLAIEGGELLPNRLALDRPVERHRHLVALTDVADVDPAREPELTLGVEPIEQRCDRFRHLLDERPGRRRVELLKRNLVGAHDVVGGRGDEQPERGQHAGPERNHDPPDAELRREVTGMQRPCPPEGDERRLPGIAAALRHVHAHRPRHRLVDDVVHGPRRLQHRLSARPGEVLRDAVPRRIFIEAHRTAREVVGVEVAQQQVGIGHRRPGAAAVVTDRPGVGAGALRPDLDEAHGVDPGDAAPAGPNLDHVDRRHRHRKAARARESPRTRHLELVCDRHRTVADEAGLRRRSPHVERQDLRKRERLRDLAPHDGPRHRPRLDEPQREVGRGLCRAEAAVGEHHPQRRGISGARESGVEVAEVVADERLHVGVDHRGAGALVLLDLRQHLGGGGDRDLGGELSHEPRRLPFVLGVDVRVQKRDRDRAHALRPHEGDGGLDLLPRDPPKDGAVAIGTLVDGGSAVAAAPAEPVDRPRARRSSPGRGGEARARRGTRGSQATRCTRPCAR